MRRNVWILLPFCALVCLCAFPALVFAQANVPQAAGQAATQTSVTPSRITQAVDEANLTRLSGNTHPLAQARFDQGAAPDSLPMQRMLLVLKRSAAQESTLDALLDQQQDSTSANFHQWLTPQQFGQQFGPSDQDVQTITAWLQSQGFTVAGVSNGRTVIEFSGTAGQVRQAFHTEIHRYTVNGQDHWANNTDPQIPAALTPVVTGINTLYNFPRRQMHEAIGAFTRSPITGALTRQSGSQFTFPNPCAISGGPPPYPCNFAVGPEDFAKIYDVPNIALKPAPATQYNGDNQTIVLIGQSDINPKDSSDFRILFGLPPATLNQIPVGPDPGIVPPSTGEETEADLDVQWAGAVAPNATLDLVTAESTEVSLGADLAAQYAVDDDLAPVISDSYGICEFFMGAADNAFYNQLWQQAAAEGITVSVAAGDGGSGDCDYNAGTYNGDEFGLSVNGVASTPYNIAVGGTDFNDLGNFAEYWNTTPADTPTVPSALGYVPEMTWNDTCTNQETFAALGSSSAQQNCIASDREDGILFISIAGGGGQSNCTASDGENVTTCSGGNPKPPWQTALTPSDAKRDLPDVSLFASNGFNDSFYPVCEIDLGPAATSCDPYGASDLIGVGGTSASAPAFAGIMALIDQKTGERQGNANYVLYHLASAESSQDCVSSASSPETCVFNDVTVGTIAAPCVTVSPDCVTSIPGNIGVLSGYAASPGYDLASGLGSINAGNLLNNWDSSRSSSSTSLTLNGGAAVSITHGSSVTVASTVSPLSPQPTGSLSLIATQNNQSFGAGSFALTNGSVSSSTTMLPGGVSYSVQAHYSGDSLYSPSDSQPVTVP